MFRSANQHNARRRARANAVTRNSKLQAAYKNLLKHTADRMSYDLLNKWNIHKWYGSKNQKSLVRAGRNSPGLKGLLPFLNAQAYFKILNAFRNAGLMRPYLKNYKRQRNANNNKRSKQWEEKSQQILKARRQAGMPNFPNENNRRWKISPPGYEAAFFRYGTGQMASS